MEETEPLYIRLEQRLAETCRDPRSLFSACQVGCDHSLNHRQGVRLDISILSSKSLRSPQCCQMTKQCRRPIRAAIRTLHSRRWHALSRKVPQRRLTRKCE